MSAPSATTAGIPRHVAIIMDGNGRWAARRRRPRMIGHRAGARAVNLCIDFCLERGIAALTLFAFSSENWGRPADEVGAEVGVVPYPGQGQRVQQLQHQRADTANQHAREVAMHPPTDAMRAEQAGVALGRFEVQLAEGQPGEAHDLGFDAAA